MISDTIRQQLKDHYELHELVEALDGLDFDTFIDDNEDLIEEQLHVLLDVKRGIGL